MIKSLLIKIISISILLITVSSVNQWSDYPIGNTYIWWAVELCILIIFIKSKGSYYNTENNYYIKTVKLYVIWNIICLVRGMFIADNYWEWKNLISTGMVLLLPLSIYITTNERIIQKIISDWLSYALPAFFLFLPFLQGEAIGRYLVPISFLILFFPILSFKWKVITISFTLFIILIDLDARSNVIKFFMAFSLSMLYYFRFLISSKLFNFIRLTFIFAPLVFLILGIFGWFNIFKMDEYIKGDYTVNVISEGNLTEADLTSDTRTFLYIEVLNSAIKYNYMLFGRTPARGNESESFGYHALNELKTGKKERFSNEVSILNIFTWTGFIGVILYLFVFYKASFLAINKSNNIIIKIIGLYVAFRWSYAWVEDFSNFDLSFFLLWALIGMCFSKVFRGMSDFEMKYWVLGIFKKRYRKHITSNSSIVSNTIYQNKSDTLIMNV